MLSIRCAGSVYFFLWNEVTSTRRDSALGQKGSFSWRTESNGSSGDPPTMFKYLPLMCYQSTLLVPAVQCYEQRPSTILKSAKDMRTLDLPRLPRYSMDVSDPCSDRLPVGAANEINAYLQGIFDHPRTRLWMLHGRNIV